MKPQAFFFDFNGTISQDEPILCSIFVELFAEFDQHLSRDEYFNNLAGNSDLAIVRKCLGVTGLDAHLLVQERVRRYETALCDGRSVPDATRQAIRYASRYVPLIIVSGAWRSEIECVLQAAGVREYIHSIISADDVWEQKPNPEGYRVALALLDGVRGHQVVAFEDTAAGIEAAKSAGIRCFGVRGTQPVDRLTQADQVVDGLRVELLHQLLEGVR